jgi:hypothetical protein
MPRLNSPPARADYVIALVCVVGCLGLFVWLATRGTVALPPAPAALAPPLPAPTVGQVCRPRPQDNPSPWPVEAPQWAIEVLDVQDGWVRYKLLTEDARDAARFRDLRATVEGFAALYRCEEATP